MALRQILPEAIAQGLIYVELTADTDNIASQQVILANGGRLIDQKVFKGYDKLENLYRIVLG